MIDLHKTTRDWRSGQEAELEDPELTSFHIPQLQLCIYRATVDEKDQKTSRRDLLQLKTKKRNHSVMGRQSGGLVE